VQQMGDTLTARSAQLGLLGLDALRAAHKSPQHVAALVEHHKVSIGPGAKHAFVRAPSYARRVCSSSANRLEQSPSGKLRKIAHRTIHGQNAAGKFALKSAFAVVNIDLDRSKSIAPVRHSGGSSRIRHKHRQFPTFRLRNELDDCRIKMNAIRDDVSADARVSKHRANNARIAMSKWSHGIKDVSRMASASVNRALCGRKIGIRMPQTHAHSARRRRPDQLDCPLKLRRKSHHANVPARRLPKTLKRFN